VVLIKEIQGRNNDVSELNLPQNQDALSNIDGLMLDTVDLYEPSSVKKNDEKTPLQTEASKNQVSSKCEIEKSFKQGPQKSTEMTRPSSIMMEAKSPSIAYKKIQEEED